MAKGLELKSELEKQDVQVMIAKVLGTQAKPLGEDVFRLELTNTETDRKLALEIHVWLLVQG
mgnify:CR=1 FL=1